MDQSLNVIALISGGKDSLYSILHCIENGHQVVALANLYPPTKESQSDTSPESAIAAEDLDSFMFQTVGHRVIPLYEKALGLPLYRQAIVGTAVNRDKSYHFDSQLGEDEIESLFNLLNNVKRHHPEANAVSSGAILSDYQRTRVESVALRLGLVPLAFLWQFPELPPFAPSALLTDMSSVDFDARIIKTASGGLDQRHLWLNVASVRAIAQLQNSTTWQDAHSGAILGEGGEFETLAIDGPRPLWKQRIEVTQKRELSAGAGSWIVSIAEARCVPKQGSNIKPPVRRPQLVEPMFDVILDKLSALRTDPVAADADFSGVHYPISSGSNSRQQKNPYKPFELVNFRPAVTVRQSVKDQAIEIIRQLETILKSSGTDPSHILSTQITLRDMSTFSEINEIYGSIFKKPNPPARVTVGGGAALPEGTSILLSVVLPRIAASEHQKEALHVQSQSYWAPANIGPYAQAISYPLSTKEDVKSRFVFVAGQIPLAPASMQIAFAHFEEQAVLSLQHLWRIGRSMRVHWWTGAITYIIAKSEEQARARSNTVSRIWHLAHADNAIEEEEGEEPEDFDVGDQSLFKRFESFNKQVRIGPWPLPDPERVATDTSNTPCPPCFTIQVDGLPRSALIEWTSHGVNAADGERVKVRNNGDECQAAGCTFAVFACNTVEDLRNTLQREDAQAWSGSITELWVDKSLYESTVALVPSSCAVTPCLSLWAGETQIQAIVRLYTHTESDSS